MSANLEDAALAYAARGWPVFPLVPRGKVPLVPKAEGGNGVHDATTDAETIRRWWSATPDANIGLACGGAFVALDLDGEAGAASFGALLNGTGEPCTPTSRTGRGRHLLFAPPAGGLRNRAGVCPGLDVRGTGGYIVAPPSVHETGHVYAWEHGPETALAPMPEPLLALLESPAPGAPAPLVEGTIAAGARNHTLASLAGTMRRRGMTREAMLAALLVENRTRCDPPLTEQEVEAIAESVGRYTPAAPPPSAEATAPDLPVEYLDLAAIRAQGIPAVPWIVEGWLASEDIVLMSGDGGIGKSTTAGALAVAVESGGTWCGLPVLRSGRVLVFDEEQSVREASRLYLRLCAPDGLRLACQQGLNLTTAEGLRRIARELGAHRPALAVFDSVQQVFAGVDGNDAAAVARVYADLFRLRREYGCAFLLIGHLRKPPTDGRMAALHLVHGSVAFGTQASTVWVATQPARGLMDLVQVKRRDGERTSLRIRYSTEGPDAPIILAGEGAVEEGETTTERAENFLLRYLAEKGTSPTKWIMAAAAAETPALPARSVQRALKRMVDVLKVACRPRQGYYALRAPGDTT